MVSGSGYGSVHIHVCAQCICSVGVVYCVSVHLFVYGQAKNQVKEKMKTSQQKKRDDKCDRCGFEPTPSACEPSVLSRVLLVMC